MERKEMETRKRGGGGEERETAMGVRAGRGTTMEGAGSGARHVCGVFMHSRHNTLKAAAQRPRCTTPAPAIAKAARSGASKACWRSAARAGLVAKCVVNVVRTTPSTMISPCMVCG